MKKKIIVHARNFCLKHIKKIKPFMCRLLMMTVY